MPDYDTTYLPTRVPKAKPKKRKRPPHPSNPEGGPHPVHTYHPPPRPPSPAGDQAGETGIARGNRFKKTKAYRGAIKAAYKHSGQEHTEKVPHSVGYREVSPLESRRQNLAGQNLNTPEGRMIARLHEQRVKSDAAQRSRYGFLVRSRYGTGSEGRKLARLDLQARRLTSKMPSGISGDNPTQRILDSVRADLYKSTPAYASALQEAHDAPLRQAYKNAIDHYAPIGPQNLQGAVDTKLVSPVIKMVLGGPTSAAAVAEGLYHRPGHVIVGTGKQAVLAIPASLGGIASLVAHPKKELPAYLKGAYQSLTTPYHEKVKRVEKNGGFEDLSNAALVAAPEGAVARKLIEKAGGAKYLERAKLRVSGDIVKDQRQHSAIRDLIGHQLDKRRAAKMEQALQDAEDGGKPIDALRRAAAKANAAAGRPVEIVPHTVARKQRRILASDRGKSIYRLKHDQSVRINALRKKINQLNPDEKRAFYYAAAFGIRTAKQAAELLPSLRERIAQARKDEGLTDVPGSLAKSDMLPDLDKIIANPKAHFTERLGSVVEAIREEAERAGREDPALNEEQRLARTIAPVAHLLQMHPGEFEAGTDWVFHPPEHPPMPRSTNANGELVGIPQHAVEPRLALPSPRGELERIVPEDTSIPHAGYYEETPRGPRYAPEEHADFLRRVATELKQRGLANPLYFKSERYVGPMDFASRALGGRRAMREDFRYRGENLKVGLQDTRPDQFLRGFARNVKRKHNWNAVAEMVDKHALTGLTHPGGATLSHLREEIYRAGIDEGSIVYWNPGVFRSHAAASALAEETGGTEAALESAGHDLAPAEQDRELLRHALSDATVKGSIAKQQRGVPSHLASTGGWQAVPVEVMRELERQTTPSRAGGRIADVTKSKLSRAILLSGNVPWATFQVASNALMTAGATGGRALNPANWLGAAKWWNELSHDERNHIGAELGLDTTGADTHAVHLGAATNNHLVNTYRAFKASPLFHSGIVGGHGPSISELNPAEAMANFDRWQNNMARILTAYTGLKRDAARDMSHNMLDAARAQNTITNVLSKKSARAAVTELAKNPEVLERHAEAVHDWLGDYTSLTSAERKVVNRFVMFYPYLRYSLKLVFYTLPTKHPIVSSIIAELGQLHTDELKKLLGGDNLYWNTGKVYFGSGDHVTSVDLRRANPALNALFDAAGQHNAASIIGNLPPYAEWIADQLWSRDTRLNQDWRLHGKAAPYGGQKVSWSDPVRARILTEQVLKLFYPYRLVEQRSPAMEGTQGNDSLLLDPRPIHFKGRTYVAQLQRAEAHRQQEFDQKHNSLAADIFPFIPQANRDYQAAQAQKKITAAEGRTTRKPKRYLGGEASGIMPKKRRKKTYFGATR